MIAYIEGNVININEKNIIVNTNGVGYEININTRLQVEIDKNIALYIHLVHKEDSMTLYGFSSKEEKSMFLTLISAQGVGPKLATEVLSYYSVGDIIDILFTQNILKLKKVPGMGAKKAEKLLFELRDKINKIDTNIISTDMKSQSLNDAMKALISLGFTNTEITGALSNIKNTDTMSTELIITEALKILAIR